MASRQAAHDVLRRWITKNSRSQTDLAKELGVTRAAVSKWCLGSMNPSQQRAQLLEHITDGAVPATIWPRQEPRQMALPPGAAALREAAKARAKSIIGLAREVGVQERAMARWASGHNIPRPDSLAKINATLGLKLSFADFQVGA